MEFIIGIDVGGSITKIAGMCGDEIIGCLQVKANDPIASIYGALGKFLSENDIALSEVGHIVVTGVGSSGIKSPIFGIPTLAVDEFYCTGRGGLWLTGIEEGVIVSMGTGTAFIHATNSTVTHLGGTGVGGGALLGMSSTMLNIRDVNNIIKLAESGNLNNVDLTISDITKKAVSNLPPTATASNFGKVSELATQSDIALGIFNMVYQTIGVMAVFAARSVSGKDIVLTGSLAEFKVAEQTFKSLSAMFGVNFIIPDSARFATAIGAARSYGREPFTEIK